MTQPVVAWTSALPPMSLPMHKFYLTSQNETQEVDVSERESELPLTINGLMPRQTMEKG